MEADQLIAEVARTTGLRLDKADPILAAAVINEALLDRALMKLDRQVKIQADRVTAASTQAVLDAEKAAEALLTEVGDWVEKRIRVASDAAVEPLILELRQEYQRVESTRRKLKYLLASILFALLLMLCGIIGMLLAIRL